MNTVGRLPNQVLLITGSTGIAAACAEKALAEGAKVLFTTQTEESGRQLMERLASPGKEIAAEIAHLEEPASAENAVRACVQRYGRLDALFNVAGASGRPFGDGPLDQCTDQGWDMTLTHNLKTMFLVSRAALRQMLAQDPDANRLRGTILNMSSVVATSPSSLFATHAYAASKGAVLSLTRAMAAYYAPHGIRVNAIAPGLVRTPMSARAQHNPQILSYIKTKQPLTGHMLEAEAVAQAAIFLLSPEASAVTGEVLTVDGGWSISEGQYDPTTE